MTDKTMIKYNEIIDKYRRKNLLDNVELEVKIKADDRKYKTKYFTDDELKTNIKDFVLSNKFDYTYHQIIDFIYNFENKKMIKHNEYKNGKLERKMFYSKKLLFHSLTLSDLPIVSKATLSDETVLSEDEFNESEMDFIRFKERLSIRNSISEFSDWRIDITLIREYNIIGKLVVSNIKTLKDKLFKSSVDIKDFINSLNNDEFEYIEIEIERENQKTLFKEEIFKLDEITKSFIEFIFPSLKIMKIKTEYDNLFNKLIGYIKPYLLKTVNNMTFKRLLNKVKELENTTYFSNVIPSVDNFYITDKIDGLRTILMVEDNDNINFITNDSVIPYECKNDSELSQYILDGELYEDYFYPFDLLVYKGKNILDKPFSYRFELLSKAIDELSFDNIRLKRFKKLSKDNYINELKQHKIEQDEEKEYIVDGVIFIKDGDSYDNTMNYKWKPLEKLSIDFAVRKCPDELLGIFPYVKDDSSELYLLFSGFTRQFMRNGRMEFIKYHDKLFEKSRNQIVPIQFSPSSNPYAHIFKSDIKDLDNKICEMVFNPLLNKWKFLRIRDERTKEYQKGNDYGNFYMIAEKTWENYFSPLTFRDLITPIDKIDFHYFMESDNMKYKSTRSFNSFVKSELLRPYAYSNWVVDLAAGKGQDIFRINNLNIKNYLAIDYDHMALKELINRKHLLIYNSRKMYKPMKIYSQQFNLKQDHSLLLKQLESKGINIPMNEVDLITMNFAFHYFTDSLEHIENIITLVKTLLKSGGVFLYTSFDGNEIFDLLKNDEGEWNIYDDDKSLKYSIKKKYTEKRFERFGQKIDVLLPFSKETYYEEYLVNNKFVTKLLEKNKFTLKASGSFANLLPKFEKVNNRVYSSMSPYDQKYSSLYHYNIFVKK